MIKKVSATFMALVMVVAMSVTAFASEFTPSVTAKPAPTVASAEIYNEDGQVVATVPSGSITVTPLSEATEASEADPAIKAALEAAKAQLQSTNLIDLVPSISDILAAYSASITTDDLAISDLFDVTLSDEMKAILATSGNSIKITFDLGLSQDDLLIVLHNYSGSAWELISNDKVVINANDTVTVEFDSFSPIAFVVDASTLDGTGTGESPDTGSTVLPAAFWGAIAIGSVTLGVLVLSTRKKAVK